MTKRRTEITVETERLVVAHSQRTIRVFCVRCGMEVEAAATPADETPDASAPANARGADEPEADSH